MLLLFVCDVASIELALSTIRSCCAIDCRPTFVVRFVVTGAARFDLYRFGRVVVGNVELAADSSAVDSCLSRLSSLRMRFIEFSLNGRSLTVSGFEYDWMLFELVVVVVDVVSCW